MGVKHHVAVSRHGMNQNVLWVSVILGMCGLIEKLSLKAVGVEAASVGQFLMR
jgi:hypothetical protein